MNYRIVFPDGMTPDMNNAFIAHERTFLVLKEFYCLINNIDVADLPEMNGKYVPSWTDQTAPGLFAREVLRRAFAGSTNKFWHPRMRIDPPLDEIDGVCLGFLRIEQGIRSVLNDP